MPFSWGLYCKISEECLPKKKVSVKKTSVVLFFRPITNYLVAVSCCSGKTTLTESLQKALGAALLKSPPQCLGPFRQLFDSEPPVIRRAFYALGNYITAAQIQRDSSQRSVIVDRSRKHPIF